MILQAHSLKLAASLPLFQRFLWGASLPIFRGKLVGSFREGNKHRKKSVCVCFFFLGGGWKENTKVRQEYRSTSSLDVRGWIQTSSVLDFAKTLEVL